MIPKLHHIPRGFPQRNLQKSDMKLHQNMPARRTYEHHLAAFCCHNSPFTPFKCGTFPDWFSVRDVPTEETVWNSVATNRRIVAPFLPRGKWRTGDIDTAVELRTETCSIHMAKWTLKKVVQDTFLRFIFRIVHIKESHLTTTTNKLQRKGKFIPTHKLSSTFKHVQTMWTWWWPCAHQAFLGPPRRPKTWKLPEDRKEGRCSSSAKPTCEGQCHRSVTAA